MQKNLFAQICSAGIDYYYIEHMKEIREQAKREEAAMIKAYREREAREEWLAIPNKCRVIRLSELKEVPVKRRVIRLSELKKKEVNSPRVSFSDVEEVFEIPARKVIRISEIRRREKIEADFKEASTPRRKVIRLVKSPKIEMETENGVQSNDTHNCVDDHPQNGDPLNYKQLLKDKYTSKSALFHIEKLVDFPEAQDVEEWVRDPSNSIGYRRIRYSFLKSIGKEDLVANKTGLEGDSKPKYKQGEQKKAADKGATSIEKAIESKIVNEWTLFGCILPPRRCRDTCTLEIVNVEPKEIGKRNLFVKQTKQFIFGDYKTFSTYGVQRFTLGKQDFPYLDDASIEAATTFLMSKVAGWMFLKTTHRKENVFSTAQKRNNGGFVSNDARRWWSRRVFAQGNNANYLKLCSWLAHTPGTNAVIYSEAATA